MPDERRIGIEWQDNYIPAIGVGGLNMLRDSELIDNNELLQAKNVIIDKTAVLRDSGYALLRDTFLGNPRRIFQHISADDSSIIFLITNLSVYRDVGTTWGYVSNGTDTTLNANASGGATSVSVASIAGFADTDRIGITLDDGTQHKTTVNGTPSGNTIVITDALPGSGVVATSGNVVVEGMVLTGTDDNPVVALSIPWNDWMVFTNGIDKPQYYDPATAQIQVIPNLPSSGNTLCVSLALYDASLLLLNTTEGGAEKPRRLRWSERANASEWVTGEAGFQDLFDFEDPIRQGLNIGPYLSIYREDSITRMNAINTVSQRFEFETVVTGQGIISTYGVVDLEDKHLIWGNDNFYFYKGGFDIQAVGDNIKDDLFGSTGTLDESNSHKAFMVYIEQKEDVLCFYQSTDGTNPDKCLRFEAKTGKWTTREFEDQITGFGEAVAGSAPTWTTITGTWNDQQGAWNSLNFLGSNKTLAFGTDNDAGNTTKLRTVEYDFTSPDDNGVAIGVVLETKDFGHPNFMFRHDYTEIKVSGGQMTVDYSADSGVSWVQLASITPGATPKVERMYAQFVTRAVRFRITANNGFALYFMNIRFKLEFEW